VTRHWSLVTRVVTLQLALWRKLVYLRPMLGWSINLFRVFGIQLAVHGSFFLLLAFYGYKGWQNAGPIGAAWAMGLIILFFCCVVMHELGHSLTAMRYGIRVPRILLLPIGGMAEMESIPRKPSAEFFITIMGPAVNFAIVIVLLPFVWNTLWLPEDAYVPPGEMLLLELGLANLIMGVFNMLPVFPMDGGRILRAFLATQMDYLRATYWAAMVTKIIAPLLALVAFYNEWPLLGILFIFIWFVGDAEYRALLRREREAAYWAEWSRRVGEPIPPLPPR
jgi:Zn-dependent protease